MVTIFKNFREIVAHKNITEVLEMVKNGLYRQQISHLRKLLKNGNTEAYTEQKKHLLAFTPSGTFEGGRKLELLKNYSKLIILDFDKLDENQLQQARKEAEGISYTYCCFVSPSNKGIKILVRVNTPKAHHKFAFNKLKDFYENKLGVPVDPSGKDITRLCFFSFDPELYLNENAEVFVTNEPYQITHAVEKDVKKLIEVINDHKLDITSSYDDWCDIGFALEDEYGENGRQYFHSISRFNPDYNPEFCNEQYTKCLRNNNSGITIKTLFHIAKQHGITINSKEKEVTYSENVGVSANGKEKTPKENDNKVTSNKFNITEKYLNLHYDIRYNEVSNKFEYKEKDEQRYRELNENNLYVKLQKEGISISLNNLIALLKSDFVVEYNPFKEYFQSLPAWDGKTDHIRKLCNYIQTDDIERIVKHFKKWLVRTVRTAIDDTYYNKQAFIFIGDKQNSGKSTLCRFLCPVRLNEYIVENIGTDKDSLIAITENMLVNLDDLSTADRTEINALKSMFSKDKVKARLTYDKRPSVHARRASFIGSTDRWEFLTDENGSVRWLCFEVSHIDWEYRNQVNIDLVWAQAYSLLHSGSFEYELSREEIEENERINKKYQVSTPERDLILNYFEQGNSENGEFKTATDILEFLAQRTIIKLFPATIGKELKFLGFERVVKFTSGNNRYGYYVIEKGGIYPSV